MTKDIKFDELNEFWKSIFISEDSMRKNNIRLVFVDKILIFNNLKTYQRGNIDLKIRKGTYFRIIKKNNPDR